MTEMKYSKQDKMDVVNYVLMKKGERVRSTLNTTQLDNIIDSENIDMEKEFPLMKEHNRLLKQERRLEEEQRQALYQQNLIVREDLRLKETTQEKEVYDALPEWKKSLCIKKHDEVRYEAKLK
jgi:hypothetical protein